MLTGSELAICVLKKCEKRLKNVAEKFGSKEKSRTFALPFEKRVAVKAGSSLED